MHPLDLLLVSLSALKQGCFFKHLWPTLPGGKSEIEGDYHGNSMLIDVALVKIHGNPQATFPVASLVAYYKIYLDPQTTHKQGNHPILSLPLLHALCIPREPPNSGSFRRGSTRLGQVSYVCNSQQAALDPARYFLKMSLFSILRRIQKW